MLYALATAPSEGLCASPNDHRQRAMDFMDFMHGPLRQPNSQVK